ncbi:flagellar brake protein [Desulfobacula sp.]|uniref:flagellar brake protein n=1 Tax=Desulfobacula sp. TaxID=2593537 RepID=UPI002635D05C|nr:flagellar brake protein [Desulfobacula sp.]
MGALDRILELDTFESRYIDIGTKVYLETEEGRFSVTSIFVGMLTDEFMIITPPKGDNAIKDKLFPGRKMVVKYLYDGSIYAFQTSVIEMITTPISALVIHFPKGVQQRELRVAKRNNVVIPGRIEINKTGFDVLVNDINKNGCRFKYRDNTKKIALREGDFLRLYCRFPGVSDEIGAMACVRNVRKEQGQVFIGLEFQDMTKTFLTPLIHFLYTIKEFI